MTSLFEPRNARAIAAAIRAGELTRGDILVASFIGSTPIEGPHVFCDSGFRYDWRFARSLRVVVVVNEATDARRTFDDLLHETLPYPTLVDFDRQVVGSIISGGNQPKLWPRRKGSEPWLALFG